MASNVVSEIKFLNNAKNCLRSFDKFYYENAVYWYKKLKSVSLNTAEFDNLMQLCSRKKIEYENREELNYKASLNHKGNQQSYSPYIITGASSEAHAFRDNGQFGSYPLYDRYDSRDDSDEFDF